MPHVPAADSRRSHATTSSSTEPPAGLLAWLDAERLSVPARVLSLGAAASPLADVLRERGHQVLAPAPEACEGTLRELAASAPGTHDLVLAFGFVERLRWDRWALQQVHRVLRPGGVLLLAVPDLYSPVSLADPRYVAAKIAKLLPGVFRPARAGGRPGSSPRAVRSYSMGRLRAMIERLGFEPGRWAGLGPHRLAFLPGSGAWMRTHHLLLAHKRVDSVAPRGPAAQAALLRRRFESENRAFLATREQWRHRLAGCGGEPRPLDPSRLAGAHVLVLSPHPDDELVGCGGTLLRLVGSGARVTVLQATDGSASAALEETDPAVRRGVRLEEARAVERAAGFEPTIVWAEDNGAFRYRADLVARLRESLDRLGPTLVFTPFLADIHADHRTLNRILAAALDGRPGTVSSVVGYEVWSLAPANLWCEVSPQKDEVERLLLLYETAMKVDDFVHMCSARNLYHSLTLAGRPGQVEAFFACDPARFCELTRGVDGA